MEHRKHLIIDEIFKCFLLQRIGMNYMGIFKKKKILTIPEECQNLLIEVDKSICTGEMTVGFRNPVSKKLLYAELARNEEEIAAYKKKYGYPK